MVSSLEIGSYAPAQHATPYGSSSPYLTASLNSPPLAGSDLGNLMSFNGGGVRDAGQLNRPDPSLIVGRPPNNPLAMGELSYDLRRMSNGRLTSETIKNMHAGVMSAKTDATWRALMEDIRNAGRRAGAIGWKDYLGELRWFDNFYRGAHFIDYVRDPHQVELVMHPWHTFAKQGGDCDDSSGLMAGSLGALGHPHRFRSYKADPRRPDEDSHVSAQIYIPGEGWVNTDLTLENIPLGFQPQGFRTTDWKEPTY